jgi:hypothetical protein
VTLAGLLTRLVTDTGSPIRSVLAAKAPSVAHTSDGDEVTQRLGPGKPDADVHKLPFALAPGPSGSE